MRVPLRRWRAAGCLNLGGIPQRAEGCSHLRAVVLRLGAHLQQPAAQVRCRPGCRLPASLKNHMCARFAPPPQPSYWQLRMQRALNTARLRAGFRFWLFIDFAVYRTPQQGTPCTGVRRPRRARDLQLQHCIRHILSHSKPSICTHSVAGCPRPTPAQACARPAAQGPLRGRHPAAWPAPRASARTCWTAARR